MTKDEIKKALVLCQCGAVITCRKCPYIENCNGAQLLQDALNLITEQEQEIKRLKDDYAKLQEQFAKYQLASGKEILAQVKQAKIDVLNELKKKIQNAIDAYFNLDGGGYYLAEDAINDIDDLIEEVEKQ